MKKLIFMRHGKAEYADAETDDYDRSLTERSKRNAAETGNFILKQLTNAPDLIFSSEAKRALSTAMIAAEQLNYPTDKIRVEDGLYLASASRMLKYIKTISSETDTCLLVGHNPGLTDLINIFGVRLDNLPTASAVCFEFDMDNWQEITPDKAKFCWMELAK